MIAKNNNLDDTTRITVLESQVETINANLSKLEQKIDSNYSTLHTRISDLRDDLQENIDSKHEKLMEKLDTQAQTTCEQFELIAEKMQDADKWRWMIMGGAAVMGYVIAHIKLDRLF